MRTYEGLILYLESVGKGLDIFPKVGLIKLGINPDMS